MQPPPISKHTPIAIQNTKTFPVKALPLEPLRGCLHDTGATFAPGQVHSGSLSWLYICLHDTTTKCHAGASRPGVSSPRLSHRGENFTSVRDYAMVSCKRKTSTRSGGKSVCRQTGMSSACVMFAILNHTCILST